MADLVGALLKANTVLFYDCTTVLVLVQKNANSSWFSSPTKPKVLVEMYSSTCSDCT